MGIVSVANTPDPLFFSVFTGLVGFVGAVAITLVFSFSFSLFYKLVKCIAIKWITKIEF